MSVKLILFHPINKPQLYYLRYIPLGQKKDKDKKKLTLSCFVMSSYPLPQLTTNNPVIPFKSYRTSPRHLLWLLLNRRIRRKYLLSGTRKKREERKERKRIVSLTILD